MIEVPVARERMRGLLAHLGYPMLALRIGVTDRPAPVPATGRRTDVGFLSRDG